MSAVEVARVYRFDGHHSLPDVPGYEHDHKHAYRVEVVVDADRFVNTDELDAAWVAVGPSGDNCHHDGSGINVDDFCFPSTVENIAETVARYLTENEQPVSQVTVWEDETRWGRWRR